MNMNRPQRFTTSQRPTFKLPAFGEDKRLRFVDSVCATLMTRRFGDGAMYTLNRRVRGTTDEPFYYLSLLEEEPWGWHERENHLRKRVATPTGEVVLVSGNGDSFESLGRDGPTMKPPAHAGGSPSCGSPTFLGRPSSSLPLRSLASFALKKSVSRNDREGRKEDAKKSQRITDTPQNRSRSLKN